MLDNFLSLTIVLQCFEIIEDTLGSFGLGRDEKGCKMDVNGRRHVDKRRQALTVDQLEKSSLVDVDQEKSIGP